MTSVRSRASIPVVLLLTLLLLTVSLITPVLAATSRGEPPPLAFCFAPGTPDAVVEEVTRRAAEQWPSTSLHGRADGFQFSDGDRWSRTATNGGGLAQGDPTVLTWSVVPDGTSIQGFNGEPTSGSNLRAFLNGIYGGQAVWLPLFEQVFARWSALSGITYVYEPSDDGSPINQSRFDPGVRGVRGDVRITGHPIDGTGRILAYNFYPDIGDMVIDTSDGYFADTSANSLILRNTVAHEHGHGLGLRHVCPMDRTKLLEPLLVLGFDGPQHDDVLAANRGYGDRLERDDSSGQASPLGAMPSGSSVTLSDRSIDDDADRDYLSFAAGSDSAVTVLLTPVGHTYLSGPQNANGSCSAGTSFDSLRVHDLGVEVLDRDGATTLARADLNPAGSSEELRDVLLPGGAGTRYIRVFGDTRNAAQLYGLTVSIAGPPRMYTVYESASPIDVVDPGNRVGTAETNPYLHTPAPGARLFYQVDGGAGEPQVIRLVKQAPGIAISY